ncbi:MAG TPA: ABC transporter ATP-binding protein [Firmicutes bacterium]|nr:ABC transporter ATP-binding protein [Candidatus Fermentithermobacillaceae bacterium]
MLRKFRRLSGMPPYLFIATLALAALSGLLNIMPIQGVGALVDCLAGSSATQQGLTRMWLDITGRDKPYLVLLSVIIVYVVSGAVSNLYGYSSTLLGMKLAHNCRMEGARAIHQCSLRELESRPSGDVLTTLTSDVDSVQRAVTAPLIGFVVGVFELMWVLALFLYWNWAIGLGILLLTLPLYYLTRWYNNATERLTRLDRTQNGILTSMLQESLWAAAMFRIFDRRGYQFGRIRKTCEARFAIQKSQSRLAGVYWLSVRALQALGLSFALGLTIYGVLHGSLSPGNVLIAWSYLQRFYAPVLELSRFGNMIRQGLVALERVEQVKNMAQSCDVRGIKLVPDAAGQRRVKIHGVTFAYKEENVLKGVSFDIPFGQAVAVVGASGEGKSTLAKILLGLYAPKTGVVGIEGFGDEMDGRPSVAAVFQEPMLVSGTVAENILLGEDLDEKRLDEVISLVDPDLIAELPEGLETDVGERGNKLSIGQQQRIALMRALYRRPGILVADEPTSALDGHAEQRVLAALRAAKERSTVVLFSHRLSTVKFADHVLVLRDGVIREAGSPAELLERDGEFARLFASEAGKSRT